MQSTDVGGRLEKRNVRSCIFEVDLNPRKKLMSSSVVLVIQEDYRRARVSWQFESFAFPVSAREIVSRGGRPHNRVPVYNIQRFLLDIVTSIFGQDTISPFLTSHVVTTYNTINQEIA